MATEEVSVKTFNPEGVYDVMDALGNSFDASPQACADLVFVSQFIAHTLGMPLEDYINICKTTWKDAENFTKKVLSQYEDC